MSPSDVNRASAQVGPLVGATQVAADKRAEAGEANPRDVMARSEADTSRPSVGINIDVQSVADPAKPPVDTERVAQIRKALADGSYPLVPTQIADALVAARMMLTTE